MAETRAALHDQLNNRYPVKIEPGVAGSPAPPTSSQTDEVKRLQEQIALLTSQVAKLQAPPPQHVSAAAAAAAAAFSRGAQAAPARRSLCPDVDLPEWLREPRAEVDLPDAVSPTEHAASPAAANPAKTDNDRSLLPRHPQKSATGPIPLPKGIEEPVFANYAARAKEWAKYGRSLKSGPSKPSVSEENVRAKRSDKATVDILAQIAGYHEKNFYPVLIINSFVLACANSLGARLVIENSSFLGASVTANSRNSRSKNNFVVGPAVTPECGLQRVKKKQLFLLPAVTPELGLQQVKKHQFFFDLL